MPFVEAAGRRLEYQWVGAADAAAPTLAFLHEGLGSVSMWRDFPADVAEAAGCRALVYSRWGNGASEPITTPRAVDYLYDEALKSLPEVLIKLAVREPILIGHSDGGSISLIYAGSGAANGAGPPPKAMILLAPHVFVEEISVAGTREAKAMFENGELGQRLRRHHDDAEGMFRAWSDIWRHPDFFSWNIEEYLANISCPILVIQGQDDEYGSRKQVESIVARSGGPVDVLMLENCGHSPHREMREAVLAAATAFVDKITEREVSAA